jgi:hypothetical protein
VTHYKNQHSDSNIADSLKLAQSMQRIWPSPSNAVPQYKNVHRRLSKEPLDDWEFEFLQSQYQKASNALQKSYRYVPEDYTP